jgi:hypothetical protein
MWGSLVIFRSQKRSTSQNVWGSTDLRGKYRKKCKWFPDFTIRTTNYSYSYDSVHLHIDDAKKFCEHLATTALLATNGNRRIAPLKADSHIACRAHAVRQFTHAMPRPCPASTVPCPSWNSAWWPEISELLVQQFNRPPFFVVCCYHSFPRPWQTLFGFTLATCIWDWYASDNLRGTPLGCRKKPNADRSPTGRPVPWPWRTAWLEQGMGGAWQVWIRHGRTV